MMNPAESTLAALWSKLVAKHAGDWDLYGSIPVDVVRKLAESGALCPEVAPEFGGPGLDAIAAGRLAAHAGSLCSSARSLMTSQGMVAWMITRWGDHRQRERFLPALVGGETAAVAFSEPNAGSDLSALSTTLDIRGDEAAIDGSKVWITGASYADWILVFCRHGDGTAAVLVPSKAPGLEIEPVAHPLGCRAGGHAMVRMVGVVVPAEHVLPGAGDPFGLQIQSALAYGRLSIAWGCLGIIRACLSAAASHAARHEQFGAPIAKHQLVAGRLGDMYASEQIVTRLCEHAAAHWRDVSPDMVTAVFTAKHVGAIQANAVAASALQILASAGAHDGKAVARAYRDAKMMEIIEGSTEMGRLHLAEKALAVWA